MSHITTVKGEVKDLATLLAVCKRLRTERSTEGRVFSEPKYAADHKVWTARTKGYAVHLPGWLYPAVFNLETGEVTSDNSEGSWGNIKEMEQFMDEYQLQAMIDTAEAEGHVIDWQRSDEQIQFQISVPG